MLRHHSRGFYSPIQHLHGPIRAGFKAYLAKARVIGAATGFIGSLKGGGTGPRVEAKNRALLRTYETIIGCGLPLVCSCCLAATALQTFTCPSLFSWRSLCACLLAGCSSYFLAFAPELLR